MQNTTEEHDPIESLAREVINAIDERFLHTAKAMSAITASVGAIYSILVSKGIVTEDEIDLVMKQANASLADQLNNDASDVINSNPEHADEIRARYSDLTSSLTRKSSAPE